MATKTAMQLYEEQQAAALEEPAIKPSVDNSVVESAKPKTAMQLFEEQQKPKTAMQLYEEQQLPAAQTAKPVKRTPTDEEEEMLELPEWARPARTAFNWVRKGIMGEVVPELASKALGEKRGAEVSRELDLARRGGHLPGYREVGGSFPQSLAQFGANAAGDVVAVVGSKLSLPLELGVMAGRDIGRYGGTLTTDAATAAYRAGFEAPAKYMFGEVAAKALAKQQAEKQFATEKALEESSTGWGEFAKGALFGASPALFETVRGAGEEALKQYREGKPVSVGDVALKGWESGFEAFLAYPIASILPGYHLAVKPALKKGGTVVEKEGEPLQTITGKPVVLNKAGQVFMEPATRLRETKTVEEMQGVLGDTVRETLDWGKRVIEPNWQKIALDITPARDVQRQRGLAAATVAASKADSPAAIKLKNAVTNYDVLRDMEAELAGHEFEGATEADKFAAIEGTLGVKSGETTGMRDVPVLDKTSRAAAQELGELLMQHGLDENSARMAIPFTLLEGMRAVRSGKINDPVRAIMDVKETLASLEKTDPIKAKEFVRDYGEQVRARNNDPNFVAMADIPWTGQGYRWVPGAEVRQRNGYMQAVEAARKADKEAGKLVFDLHVPEIGELRKDYSYQLYDNIIDDLRTSPQSRERATILLRSNPIARIAANPTAPNHTKALVAWAMQPGGKRQALMQMLNDASLETAMNMGVDPLIIAKRYDTYLSRAFTDAIDGGIKLDEYVKQLGADPQAALRAAKEYRSPRYKRKVSEETSNERLTKLIANKDISLHDALAATVTNAIAMNFHLDVMAKMYDALSEKGLVFDEPRPGLVHTSTELAAPTKSAASRGEYNLAYGKMGDKWVDPWIANELKLIPTAFERVGKAVPFARWIMDASSGLLGLNRTTHTTLNVPLYGVRQAIQDPVLVMAASGLNPYTGKGRKLMLEVMADSDRFVRTRDDPNGAVISPRMKEMQEAGFGKIFDEQYVTAMADLTPTARQQVLQQVNYIHQQTVKATDLGERVGAFAKAAMYTRAFGRTIPHNAKSLLYAWADKNAERNRLVAKKSTQIGASLGSASKYLGYFNEHLHRSALAISLAQAEMTRVMWAYNVARDHLKLDPERAAIFVRESVYGQERPSPTMQDLANFPILSLVGLPLFLRFGAWQTTHFARRAFNDRHVWDAYVFGKALDAMNEDELLKQPNGDKNWQHRLAQIHSQHTAVADVGLNTVGGVQEAMRALKMPESVVKAIGNPNDPITIGLSDIIGGQTFFHQIDSRKQGVEALFQLGIYGGSVVQLFNDTKEMPGAPEIGLAPGDTSAWKEYARGIVAKTFPSSQVVMAGKNRIPVPMGKTLQALAGLAVASHKGEMPFRNAYGDKINPITQMAQALGPGMPNVIDSVAAARSIDRVLKAKSMEFNMEAHKYANKRIDPNLKENLRNAQLSEVSINSTAKMQQLWLSLAWQYNFLNRNQAMAESQRIENLRRASLESIKKGGTGGDVLSGLFDNGIINAARDSVIKALIDADEEIDNQEKED